MYTEIRQRAMNNIKLNKTHPVLGTPLVLYEHQKECSQFVKKTLNRESWAAVLHDAGLGKTTTILACWTRMIKTNPNLRLIVSCPACTLRDVWEEHVKVWLPTSVSVIVIDKTEKIDKLKDKDYDIILITRNIVARSYTKCWNWQEKSVTYTDAAGREREKGSFVKTFPAQMSELFKKNRARPTLLVVDESHYLRNYGDRKVCLQAHHQMAKYCEYAIINTATPVCNKPEDVAGQLYAIAVDKRGTTEDIKKAAFPQNWRIGKYIISQIPVDIFQNNSHRKTEEILELPKLEIKTVSFELQLKQKHAEIYNEHLSLAREARTIMKEKGDKGGDLETMLEMLKSLTRMSQMIVHPKLEEYGAADLEDKHFRYIAKRPSPMLLELSKLVKRLQKKNNKIIIFGIHTNSIMEIARQRIQLDFPNTTCSVYSGSLNQSKRSRTIKNFLAPTPQPQILFIQMIAGGVGLNLVPGPTAAIFIQQSWNPKDHLQAYKRIHRIGQYSKVKIYNLVCAGTPDAAIREVHEDKILAADAVLNPETFQRLNDKPWRTKGRVVDLCELAATEE